MSELKTLNETTISVVIPTLNEAGNVRQLVQRLHSALSGRFLSYELIFVDDHSSDDTVDILHLLAERYPISIYLKRGKPGKAFSLTEGFSYAKYELVAILDADLQYPPEVLPEMAQKVLNGAGVVVGKRLERKTSWARKIFSKSFNFFFCRLLHDLEVDVQSGIKVFHRESLGHISEPTTPWTFDLEFLLAAQDLGLLIESVNIVFENRSAGESKINNLFLTSWELGANALKLKLKRLGGNNFAPNPEQSQSDGFYHKGNLFVSHNNLASHKTAFKNLTSGQKLLIFVVGIIFLETLFYNWHLSLLLLLGGLTLLYFFDLLFNFYLIYASFKHQPEIKISDSELHQASDRVWPVYTVFCPLYKEWQVLPQFAQAIKNLDYPKDRLQVMLLLEEDDAITIAKARSFDLPENFEIHVVPHSKPKTKPKAMNFGLKYARGQYIVIYDAEDVPEKEQLKKAVLAFERLDERTLCVQAKLNYYNPRQNLLTRIFTAEYSLWFDLILPGLQSIDAPIPLGGTSNHFKADALRHLKGWDAFNVTEDCDLGMRLSKQGFKTAILESTTYEEANSKSMNWFRQRSRWIKGYMQTYFVHSRQPQEFFEYNGSPFKFFAFQMLVGGKILSLLINPLMWMLTILYFAFRAHVGTFIESFFPGPILYMGVFAFVFGNFLYLYYYMIGCAKRGFYDLIKYAYVVPIYWLAMSAAALKGAYEVIVKPHYWAKTVHGLHLSKPGALAQAEDPEISPAPGVSYFAKFKKLSSSNLGKGGFYVFALLFVNFVNFVFNAILGRTLTLEDFGVVTLFNTVLALLSVIIAAMSSSVTYLTAFLTGKKRNLEAISFTRKTQRKVWYFTITASIIWVILVPEFGVFFNVQRLILILLFTPVITLYAVAGVQTGFLKGKFYFNISGKIGIIEALSKLIITSVLIYVGLHSFAAVGIPTSIVISFLVTILYARKHLKKSDMELDPVSVRGVERFPAAYFWAATISGVAGTAFLNIDVLLAKHYLDPTSAGAYALLSLIGKMVYFLGSLLSAFVVSIVSRHEGAGTNPRKDFYRLFNGTFAFTFLAFLGVGIFGKYTIPLLFGHSSLVIVPNLIDYCLAMALYTLANTVISYQLAKRNYSFAGISLVSSILLVIGIVKYHGSIDALTDVMLLSASINFLAIFGWYAIKKNARFVFRNITDMLDVFIPLPVLPNSGSGKRILIFNWRDTKHIFAGGAETYIHELAKRWVEQGNEVTLFCGNDGKSLRNEIVDGIRIVRRGGFYLVYLWAFLYYMVQFRGRFDIVIDCENGIPFFTPLYVKEPVFCLMHHVHQDVFRKYLSWPLAKLAGFLEAKAMPFAYRKTKFITVSKSSQKEMESLGLGLAGTEIIFPGVDLQSLKPGLQNSYPTILYLGRLQAYKSVDVLLKAFKLVLEKIPQARLVIAGGGEHQNVLRRLSTSLGLDTFVDFRGKVSEEEKVTLLQQAWIFVNPSLMEGWGITTIEANACGVPVVASNVPGLRDSVQNPHTGYLVEYGNVVKFSERITELLENDKLRAEMSADSIKWAQNFDWNSSSRNFIDSIS